MITSCFLKPYLLSLMISIYPAFTSKGNPFTNLIKRSVVAKRLNGLNPKSSKFSP